MSTSQRQQQLAGDGWITRPSEIEAMADDLLALVEEFEPALSEGHVPPAFAKRLIRLRQTAGRLFP